MLKLLLIAAKEFRRIDFVVEMLRIGGQNAGLRGEEIAEVVVCRNRVNEFGGLHRIGALRADCQRVVVIPGARQAVLPDWIQHNLKVLLERFAGQLFQVAFDPGAVGNKRDFSLRKALADGGNLRYQDAAGADEAPQPFEGGDRLRRVKDDVALLVHKSAAKRLQQKIDRQEIGLFVR